MSFFVPKYAQLSQWEVFNKPMRSSPAHSSIIWRQVCKYYFMLINNTGIALHFINKYIQRWYICLEASNIMLREWGLIYGIGTYMFIDYTT